jgi:hypothetical protein
MQSQDTIRALTDDELDEVTGGAAASVVVSVSPDQTFRSDLRITNSGNVVIGRNSPEHSLSINT